MAPGKAAPLLRRRVHASLSHPRPAVSIHVAQHCGGQVVGATVGRNGVAAQQIAIAIVNIDADQFDRRREIDVGRAVAMASSPMP